MSTRLLVDGLGLMGASLAAAASQAGMEVWCHHRRPEVSAEAQQRGWGTAVSDPGAAPPVDIIVTCVPVSVIPQRVHSLQQQQPQAIITDVGSSKGRICSQLDDLCHSGAFIGSHPMCGSHAQGLAHADPNLYQGATVVLTPTANTPDSTLTPIASLWQDVGGQVHSMSPEAHDQAVAEASHLPHILAAQAARLLSEGSLPLAASGFRDTTRVAAASPQLWTDILMDNHHAVLASLEQAQEHLTTLHTALAAGDAEAITAWLTAAQARRQRFHQQSATGTSTRK
ncbi:MAG: prephenate dehydrogenase/arogenate dehydrogenase family protein [Planctomycetota bacterium]|nr:MAG: prephenate dehydrogenase/arogenate dehydrogenase family protein [Planctomycetota bacterium]